MRGLINLVGECKLIGIIAMLCACRIALASSDAYAFALYAALPRKQMPGISLHHRAERPSIMCMARIARLQFHTAAVCSFVIRCTLASHSRLPVKCINDSVCCPLSSPSSDALRQAVLHFSTLMASRL